MISRRVVQGLIALHACLCLLVLAPGSYASNHMIVRRHSENEQIHKRQYANEGDTQTSQDKMKDYASRSLAASNNHDTNGLLSVINDVLNTPNLNQKYDGQTWGQQKFGQYDNSDDPNAQVSWFELAANQPPGVDLDTGNGGWKALPETIGCNVDGLPSVGNGQTIFNLDETMNVTQVTKPDGRPIVQPLYVLDPQVYGGDNSKVKRVIISLPGKPRDTWKYINLHFNVRENLIHKGELQKEDVVIAAPAFLNEEDQSAGAVKDNYIFFKQSGWAIGGTSKGPQELSHGITSFRVLDLMAQKFIQDFPNLSQIVFAGHSMGGQAVQRYAVAKNSKWYDDGIKYWIGNPGSWVWVTGDRPIENPDGLDQPCDDKKTSWPYGLDNPDAFPKYVKDKYKHDPNQIASRFRSRQVQYSLGLLDNGQGSTQCAAMYQGYNHLQRGSFFMQSLCNMPGGCPQNHTLAYIAGVSHQDYEMIAANESSDFLFKKDLNNPPISTLRQNRKPHHSGSNSSDNSAKHEWEGPLYRDIAWGVLAGIVVVLVLGLFCFHRIFRANANDWDRDYWEYDSKRRLL